MRSRKLSMVLVNSSVANFAFTDALYSSVFKSIECISLFPPAPFTFLKNPCSVLLPSHLFSTIFAIKPGILNDSIASSFGQLAATPLATCTSVSNPTTSQVRKVADLGRPKTGPVNLSTSSMVKPIFSTK